MGGKPQEELRRKGANGQLTSIGFFVIKISGRTEPLFFPFENFEIAIGFLFFFFIWAQWHCCLCVVFDLSSGVKWATPILRGGEEEDGSKSGLCVDGVGGDVHDECHVDLLSHLVLAFFFHH